MRKRMIEENEQQSTSQERNWLDLGHLAIAELSSENPEYPLESALHAGKDSCWRADKPGEQTIRLSFDSPQSVRHIHLLFCEEAQERTQQFTLSWSSNGGQSYSEIVRQQYNFSPPETEIEKEQYDVCLDGLTNLELTLVPDISGSDAYASISELRLGT